VNLPWQPFLTVWGLLAANIASPGPNILNTVATALGSGRRAGFGSAAGVGFGIAIWCLGMSVGVAAVLAVLPGLRLALTLLAIVLLLSFARRYLAVAWAGWRGARRGLPTEREGLGFAAAFRRSLAVNALNPKALTTWIAILTVFPVGRADAGDIALLCAGACLLSFSIHSAYTLAFSTPLAARAYLRAGWLLSAAAGLFFAGFALHLAADLLRG
jgi:threonine/homoserine/homoserine lactone efflux protein